MTDAELREHGYRHGVGGIVYYPPSVWGTDGGWGSRSPNPPAPATRADKLYAIGYRDGRKRMGCPDEGCHWFDEVEPGVWPHNINLE